VVELDSLSHSKNVHSRIEPHYNVFMMLKYFLLSQFKSALIIFPTHVALVGGSHLWFALTASDAKAALCKTNLLLLSTDSIVEMLFVVSY